MTKTVMHRGINGFLLVVDSIATLIFGFLLFFVPEFVGNIVFQRQTDGVHWHLIRCIGGQLLASSFIFFSCSNRHIETKTTCFTLRLVSTILIIFLFSHAKYADSNLIEKNICNGIIYSGFIIICFCFFFLLSNNWKIGSNLQEKCLANILYQLDTIASITIGMAWISHPHWLLHRQVNIKMDESHSFCGQIMGIFFVSSQIISTHALHWKEDKDRSMAAEARAVCCIFILLAQIWSQFAYQKDWSGAHWIGILLFSSWTAISILYRISLIFLKPSKKLL